MVSGSEDRQLSERLFRESKKGCQVLQLKTSIMTWLVEKKQCDPSGRVVKRLFACPPFDTELHTPQGLQEKAVVVAAFLNRKLAEHENLRQEIEQLRREVEGNGR
ncbi:hypothetical protein JWJ90_00230 [Desulfobulbus rhabdoformis]|uniref:hypothetical protein n=1 Tax=Desulfobulbus rhabdoformis TaxID=34032 RepID=UPI0019642FAE|nr:hypothetical protein [Desulfobulbus rhabdoformis]MBM9612706.1 hypothetical protein [Desulfobulbus rhabdoformis]